MLDILLDALKDSAMILPFVFLIYLLMEIIEGAKNKEKIEKAMSGRFAPLVASLTGIVPECGFSVALAKLFDKGLITIGTLIAGFIATSDEGLIILITRGVNGLKILELIGIKIVYGTIIGLLLNIILKKFNNTHHCSQDGECMECGEVEEKKIDKYLWHPLLHTLKTMLYFFVINLAMGVIINAIGENNLSQFLNQNKALQPLIAPLIGLIPNCASSMLLAEAYVKNILCFGALVGGLSANAGLGLLMVIKDGKNVKSAIVIALSLYIAGVIIGYICLFL